MPPQSPLLPELTPAVLQRCLPDGFDKGMRYYRSGRVTLQSHDDQHAVGKVQGSRARPYATKVVLERDRQRWFVLGTCTCPMAYDCKHVVALGRAWIAARKPAPPALAPFVPEPRVAAPALPVSGTLWQEWGTYAAGAGLAAPAESAEQLLYLLAIERDAVLVNPVRARPLKCGRLGALKPVGLVGETALDRIRGFAAADRYVLLSIDPAQRSYADGAPWYELGQRDEALLDAILATGRARHREANGLALRAGPARALAFEGALGADGNQTLCPRVDGAATAVGGEAWGWYLDPGTGEVGRTEAGALTPQLVALRAMPPLRPEHHADAVAALQRRGVAALLPAPQALRVDVRRVERPQALLTLTRPPFESDPDRLRFGVHAELAFRYDSETIDADDRHGSIRRRRGDAIDVVLREPEFERTAARFLEREGFHPVRHHDHRDPGQAAAWQRPHPLAGEAIANWVRAFGERAAPFGFAIEADERFPLHLGLELGAPELELVESGNDWFEARLGIVVDGQRIDLLPIVLRAIADPAATTARGLRVTLPDGRAALLPRERRAAILALIEDLETRGESMGVARALLPAIVPPPDWRFLPGERARAFLAELEGFHGLEAVAPPAGFRAELRPYQALGLAWLDFLRRFHFGGVLADDMGLGKTVQVLAFLARERAARRLVRPALVVCPTSVAPNWLAEAQRFAPELRTTQLASGDRSAALAALGDNDLVITSYALMLRVVEALAAQSWSVVVFDEAQWLKNSRSLSYRAALRMTAPQRLCLTGTPVENHLGELKAQFDLVFPGLLGDDRKFMQRFRHPIEKARDGDATRRLRQRLRPFLLRRAKSEVATELPPRTHIAHRVELGEAQRDLYEAIRVQMEKRVREALAERGLARSQITVLDALLKLRQVCCDPVLVDLPSARKVKESAKREALMDLLPTLIEDGRGILLFSQFTAMLDRIEFDLAERKQPFVRLDGSTRNRRAPVDRFQRGEVPLFLISLKAGGVGLNLTRADTVILYDPWWNPATEAQAIDRAHRIGQDKPVFVYELTCTGTVEEKMAALKARKKAIADAVLAGGEAAIEKLGSNDLLALFDPS